MSNFYTVTVIDEEEFSEIDFELYEEIFGKEAYNDDDDWNPTAINIGSHSVDGYPIKIDKMIKQLQAFKKKGANYVEIEYHCDHIGYPMVGLHIRRSTQEEIDIEQNKKLSEVAKRKKILELQDEIRKLQNG